MRFRFKPEDFHQLFHIMYATTTGVSPEDFAHEANRLLDEYVKTLPEVHAHAIPGSPFPDYNWFTEFQSQDTHRARLWDVQEIKPKKCQHEAECKSLLTSLPPQPVYTCRHCGKRLVAEWREVE